MLLEHERKATLNHKSEPWSSIQGEAQAGSLPFPVGMADTCCRIMGGITSSPAVLVHKASQTNMKNNDITGQAFFLRPQEATGPVQLQEIQVFLPTATGLLVHVHAVVAVTPRSYRCIYCTSH